jgi:flagellar motor switch protein FliM
MTGNELAIRNTEISMSTDKEPSGIVLATPWMSRIEEHPQWEILSQLRVSLRAAVTLNRFKVRDLLALKEGQIFESLSPDTDDVVLLAGKVQLGWSEFEVLDQRMAVRLTRLG